MKSQMGLKFQFKGKVVIIGIGNLLRADDGFGPALIELIQGRLDAVCIDAGTAPENYIGKIAKLKPETVLIVDAVELNSEAGTYAILRKSDIIKSGFTTHDISPSMFIEYLEKETNADIFMLGVQPENIRLGEEMSDKVKKTLEEIFVILTNNLRRKK